MADRLVQLSENATARKLIASLGLPLPLPQSLRRDSGPWQERPLDDRPVTFGGFCGAKCPGGASPLAELMADLLARAGAKPSVVDQEMTVWQRAGEAWSRPATALAYDAAAEARQHALIFDATALARPQDLRALYDFFQPRIRGLDRCGRAIVLGRPHEDRPTARAAAAQRALEGFVKSLGRELGRSGSTAQLVTVAEGAEDRLPALLRFFLSDRSAFVSGQVLRVTADVATTSAARATRPLQGQVALVTGAARGIGAATARTLAREGAHVVVLDHPTAESPAAEVAQEIGGTVLLVDLAAEGAIEEITAFLRERADELHVLIHNAGITRDKTLGRMTPEGWDETLAVNLDAVAALTDALRPLMASGGRIVCLSSIAGIAGNLGQTNYATSKAGVIGFVEATAHALAAEGIAVNAVAPGFIETRLTAAIPALTREVARRLSNLSQGGLPSDVAEVLTFLSSPGAAALSGQTLRVCGGSFVGA